MAAYAPAVPSNVTTPPAELVEVSTQSRSDSDNHTTSFAVPLKTRGHCGKEDCEGCKKQPCGVCHNCLNKRKTRYFKNLWKIIFKIFFYLDSLAS